MSKQGRRVRSYDEAQNGDYWKSSGGYWLAITPNGLFAALGKHLVVEHDDGSITVSPSILTKDGETTAEYHGFLERGVWRDC